MKLTKITLLSLAFVLFAGVALPQFAQAKNGMDDNESTTSSDNSGSGSSSKETENETETETEDATDDSTHQNRHSELNDRIAERRAELEDQFKQKQEDRKEKLEGKRLDICQRRENRINTYLQNSADRTKNVLAVFQKIQKGVMNFYVEKNLSSTEYDAAVKNADDKQAAAIAALDAMAGLTFSCDTTNGSNPAGVIKQAAETRHAALKAYRESVRELIKVVKAAHAAAQSTTGSGE